MPLPPRVSDYSLARSAALARALHS